MIGLFHMTSASQQLSRLRQLAMTISFIAIAHVSLSFHQYKSNYGQNDYDEKGKTNLGLMAGEILNSFVKDVFSICLAGEAINYFPLAGFSKLNELRAQFIKNNIQEPSPFLFSFLQRLSLYRRVTGNIFCHLALQELLLGRCLPRNHPEPPP